MVLSWKFRPTVILFLQEEVHYIGKDQACMKISFEIDDDDEERRKKIAALDGWMDGWMPGL